jgi:chorismate-pyruvate lyase
MQVSSKRRRWLLAVGALLVAGAALWVRSHVCVSAWVLQGAVVPYCPEGQLRQVIVLEGSNLAREQEGTVVVWAWAQGVDSEGQRLQGKLRRMEVQLSLVDEQGQETALSPQGGWKEHEDFKRLAQVRLPALADGDWRLRARATSPLGTAMAEARLALYAPARVHVLTDRPLYEPGQRVRFRALVVRSKDLTPLASRPGTWSVVDPSGEVVLEERAPADEWGVVAGDLPLDRGAPTGTWQVRWGSGGTQGVASFLVQPFTLPRFRVEASSARPYWRAGEVPTVEGQVVYSSGAPVVGAQVELRWRHSGAWPPPREWLEKELPKSARTEANGRFRLTLPRIPEDLRGQATLSASLSATDPAGDMVQGSTSLLLSEDALAVAAVTELEGGLVEGYNNRLYLRATTADGRVLPGAELTVRRAWDELDEGVRATTDEDGVAALQLDPGPPVNVVLPPMPVRRPPPPPPVRLVGAQELLSQGELLLREQLALERWLPALYPCARFVSAGEDGRQATLALRVGSGGAVVEVVHGRSRLEACMAEVLRSRALSAGPERVLSLRFAVQDPGLPTLSYDEREALNSVQGVNEALEEAMRDARTCLPAQLSGPTPLPVALIWRTRAGRKEIATSWVTLPRGQDVEGLEDEEQDSLDAASTACVQSRLSRLVLGGSESMPKDEEALTTEEGMGVVSFTAEPGGGTGEGEEEPQATTLLGYELRVSARVGQEEVGRTKLVLRPAQLPAARLRATPVLARGGEEVRVELIRGPDYQGELPKELQLRAGQAVLEAEVEQPGRVARFRLPESFEGWAEATWAGAVARVYAAPRARVGLEGVPDKATYAPGELGHLQVRTQVDGKAGPAAVGLFGVDESLGQLAPLPGPQELDGLREVPQVPSPAFGVLDGAALAMGRIRGANASAAALLRVSAVPRPEQEEPALSVQAQSALDPEAELTDAFYRVLAELAAQVRAWEGSAPAGEMMTPARMARLWGKAVEACEKRGEPAVDAYGRRLRLSYLPSELLELTDPRAVVVSGTRLPEDVESWSAWVAQEEP